MSNNQLVGSHRQGSTSVSAILSTLAPVAIVTSVALVIFLVLRRRKRRVYVPRTFLDTLHPRERTPLYGKNEGLFSWIADFRRIPDAHILNHQSLDAYLFLRFLKLLVIICVGGAVITWPILFPINITGGAGQSQLNKLSFSNVENPRRYFAHAIVAWVFVVFVMFIITRETIFFINLRQSYLLSPHHESRISSRTVLFTSVPGSYLHETAVRRLFPLTQRVWIVRDFDRLESAIQDRNKAVLQLETAEIKLSQQAAKRDSGGRSNRKSRPTHRRLPLIGPKVDTIEWCASQLSSTIPKVARLQSAYQDGQLDAIGAVFVEFTSQRAAQAAFQTTTHEKPLRFRPANIGIPPEEVIWKNLSISEWSRTVRKLMADAAVTILILFFTVPVSFIGVLTNVNYLTDAVPFLGFINDLPDFLLGVITGLLPSILLAILIALVPVLCRVLARLAGALTMGEVELTTQAWYFGFQVVQVFLVTTFTSGAAAVASQIVEQPTQAPQLLARNLPLASNFYLSYFVLYGLSVSSIAILNLLPLLKFMILSRFDKTPRKMFQRYVTLPAMKWGSLYPKFTGLAVIAITYSCIAPLILGFAAICFLLFYLAFRHNLLYSVDTSVHTSGCVYGRALQQLSVGIYLLELCLLGLFIIGTSTGSPVGAGPVALTLILTVLTVVYHVKMHAALHGLTITLPETLLAEAEYQLHPEYDLEKSQPRGPAVNAVLRPGDSATLTLPSLAPHAEPSTILPENHHTAITPPSPQTPRPGLLSRIFRPTSSFSSSVISSYLRSPELSTPVTYSPNTAASAYLPPCIRDPAVPTLWLARDPANVSRNEARALEEVVRATDERAWVDEKGKVRWDWENARECPVWEGWWTF